MKIFLFTRRISLGFSKRSPSLFSILPSQISFSSTRDCPCYRIVRIGRYKREGDKVDERKHGEIRESSLLFCPFSSARLVAFSVNTTKWRHIVSLVMAGACLSRCSHSMVDEIYRVSNVSPPGHRDFSRKILKRNTKEKIPEKF